MILSTWTLLLLIMVFLPVGILSIPLSFKAIGYLDAQEQQLESSIDWAWGLIAAALVIKGGKTSFQLRLAGIRFPTPRRKGGTSGEAEQTGKQARRAAKKAQKLTGRKEKPGLGFPSVMAALNRYLLAAILKYLKRIFKALNLRLQLNGKFGTADPACTGVLVGLITALRAERCRLNLQPDFSGPALDVVGEGTGRIIPLMILGLTLRFLLVQPVVRLWWPSFKSKFTRINFKEGAQHV